MDLKVFEITYDLTVTQRKMEIKNKIWILKSLIQLIELVLFRPLVIFNL